MPCLHGALRDTLLINFLYNWLQCCKSIVINLFRDSQNAFLIEFFALPLILLLPLINTWFLHQASLTHITNKKQQTFLYFSTYVLYNHFVQKDMFEILKSQCKLEVFYGTVVSTLTHQMHSNRDTLEQNAPAAPPLNRMYTFNFFNCFLSTSKSQCNSL